MELTSLLNSVKVIQVVGEISREELQVFIMIHARLLRIQFLLR